MFLNYARAQAVLVMRTKSEGVARPVQRGSGGWDRRGAGGRALLIDARVQVVLVIRMSEGVARQLLH